MGAFGGIRWALRWPGDHHAQCCLIVVRLATLAPGARERQRGVHEKIPSAARIGTPKPMPATGIVAVAMAMWLPA